MKTAINKINAEIALCDNLVKNIYGLSELVTHTKDKGAVTVIQPYEYQQNGEQEPIDIDKGAVFHISVGAGSISEDVRAGACVMVHTWAMRMFAFADRSDLPCDDAYAPDCLKNIMVQALNKATTIVSGFEARTDVVQAFAFTNYKKVSQTMIAVWVDYGLELAKRGITFN